MTTRRWSTCREGRQLVIAKDAIVADVHFLADDPPELVAGKLLRVNLSDLAAMGAEPLGYLTAIARPPDDRRRLAAPVHRWPHGRPAALRLPSVGRRHDLDHRAAGARP